MRTPPPVLDPHAPPLSHDQEEAPVRQRKFVRWGSLVAVILLVVMVMLNSRFSAPWLTTLLALILLAAFLGAITGAGGRLFAAGSSSAFKAFIWPSGDSTPYEEQFSQEESLVARGDMAGALKRFEEIIAQRPDAVAVRLRTAEHYSRGNRDPRRAAELFREARSLPAATQRDMLYASSRLVDLYDGPLQDPGRALVEMRRIVDQHPESNVAKYARTALRERKNQPPAAGES